MRNLFDYPGFKVLTVFFKEPYREFYLREVAAHARVSASTAKAFLDSLVVTEFLLKSRKANLVIFKANIESPMFRHFKITSFLLETRQLIRHLKQHCESCSITLYGSCARGEDDKESDIDILIVGGNQKVDVGNFEGKLHRKTAILAFNHREWEEKARQDVAFYESIITDGITLQGSLPMIAR